MVDAVEFGEEWKPLAPHEMLGAGEAQRAALEYISRGWAVTAGPGLGLDGVCSCGKGEKCRNPGKHAVGGWGNETRTTASADSARRHWDPSNPDWEKKPVDQVFIVPYLSGLIVADVDIQETWDMLPGEGFETPDTLFVSSGSGRGGHYLYKFEWDMREDMPPTVAGKLPRGAGEIKFRGIIAAPPSMHKSGGRYKWANWGKEIADAPDWMTTKREIPAYSTHTWDSLMASDKSERWPRLLFTEAVNKLGSFADVTTSRPLVMFAISAEMAKWIESKWITEEEVIDKLLDSADRNGALDVYGSTELIRQIRNGIEAGKMEKRF